jgi:hypothetical protein
MANQEAPSPANAPPSDPPSSHLTRRVINGVPYAMRKLTIEACERLIVSMVARRLLDRNDLETSRGSRHECAEGVSIGQHFAVLASHVSVRDFGKSDRPKR